MSEQDPSDRFDFPEEVDPEEHDDSSTSDTSEADDRSPRSSASPGVPLFGGTDLTADEARDVMAGSVCRLIVIAGMPRSGKTTLLATLYELFLRGPFAGYNFAGSRTQLGFDERCHKARTASRRTEADTERTLPNEVGYLHLALRDKEGDNPVRHLLFTDISGETFRDEVRNSSSGTQALAPLRRADHFVLLIDAELLADPAKRQKAAADARLILRSCVESGMIGRRTHVQVAYSRWDCVPEAEVRPGSRLDDFLAMLGSQMRAYQPHVASLEVEPLAARPTGGELALGHGLHELLRAWVENTAQPASPSAHVVTPYDGDREMTRFLWREAGRPIATEAP